ncbi:MAG: ATP-binding cassette domain-containing protein, partial [Nesterenkonia sp.]
DEYQTVLGNRGDTLSGGQRQRVAIARALIRDAPIVLLDEPTTGLDPASKSLVETSLRELTRGRTTVAITHDLSMIQSLDRVLWLEHGTIIEDGAPEELLTDPESQLAQWAATQRGAAAAGAQDDAQTESAAEPAQSPEQPPAEHEALRPRLPSAHDVLIPVRRVIRA